ncbi:MAG: energy transducer TonB [Gammaproteobacteria bacterium]|jgi:TonB family protein
MRVHPGTGIIALSALVFSGEALAEWRCDCTSIIGSCAATATVQESFIEVTSNTEQCSRVDYFVDGTPLVALVTEGVERQDWISQSATPAVIIQSCQVCLDNAAADEPPPFASSLLSEGEPTLLVEVLPAYPPEALVAGIEGVVEVRFNVTPEGTVSDAEIVSSDPAGVFEEAALTALSGWRYTRDAGGETASLTETIEFNLSGALLALRPTAAASTRAAAPGERIRNGCVQEDSRYDFGGSIDVSLVNACSEPLIVYSCAAGTGPYRDRWTCQSQEGTGTALAPSATGERAATARAGMQDRTAVSRFEISRAPNSEYWWLACAVDDTACRSDGQEWVRSLDGQIAAIDPQARTRARLARSF